jgi:septum formation protein
MIVLASSSPRRSALLQQIGVAHRVVPAQIDERRYAGESVEACVCRLAEQKARHVQRLTAATEPVLGADTAVVLDEQMLGKPADRTEGLSMLERLSGRTHAVLSAVAVAAGAALYTALSRTEVRFRTLTLAERQAYWDSGEPRDKAGAYAIQGLGALFIEELRGSYSGVMGLPLFETASLLARVGVPLGLPGAAESVPEPVPEPVPESAARQ